MDRQADRPADRQADCPQRDRQRELLKGLAGVFPRLYKQLRLCTG